MRRQLLAAALAIAAAGTAAAQPTTSLDLSMPAAGLPLAAPFTKPGTTPPTQPPRTGDDNCVPGLPCGTQLYGAARRRSVLELQVPAWRW